LTVGLLLGLLTAAPSDIRLASPGLSSAHVTPEAARFYSDHLSQKLTEAGIHVVTSTEMAALLGAERQRELLGCDNSSCLAELSAALGVDGLVTGSIGRFDRRFELNVNVVSASGAGTLASYSARVDGEEALLDELAKAARVMAPVVARALGRTLPAGPPAGTSHRAWSLIPAIAAVVGFVAAVPLLVLAKDRHDALTGDATLDGATAASFRASGPALQISGDVALAVGAVALVVAVLTFLLMGPGS
jgi:hypothetical protein